MSLTQEQQEAEVLKVVEQLIDAEIAGFIKFINEKLEDLQANVHTMLVDNVGSIIRKGR